MYPLYFDSTIIILIPAMILAMYAQSKVKSNFSKYLRVRSFKGLTGAEVAKLLLERNGLHNVKLEQTRKTFSDHYDPTKKTVRLSPEVYSGSSISAISVAAHEVGHAVQHAKGYAPLRLRTAFHPVANFGSSMAWVFLFAGLLIPSLQSLFSFGVILFSLAVLFQVITLPVEFDASKRAVAMLGTNGIIIPEEQKGVKDVLNAAALTYVAATASAVSQLLRLILLQRRRS
jgi:hypothetical protein